MIHKGSFYTQESCGNPREPEFLYIDTCYIHHEKIHKKDYDSSSTFYNCILVSGIGYSAPFEHYSSSTGVSNAAGQVTGSNSLLYSVSSNNQTFYIVSRLSNLTNDTIEINTSTSMSTYSEIQKQSGFAYSINSLRFSLQSNQTSYQQIPGLPGNLTVNRFVEANSQRLISYALVSVEDRQANINHTLSVTLVSVGNSIMNKIKTMGMSDGYYFFIPQLISPAKSPGSMMTDATSAVHESHYLGNNTLDPELRLTEKDNTLPYPFGNYVVWYLDVSLSVSSFSPGGNQYTDSISANTGTANWWLESYGLTVKSVHNSFYSEVDAYGNAFFLGVFPLGLYDVWWGLPNVSVGESFSFIDFSLQEYGSINDLILAFNDGIPTQWSDYTANYYNLVGYKDVVEYII